MSKIKFQFFFCVCTSEDMKITLTFHRIKAMGNFNLCFKIAVATALWILIWNVLNFNYSFDVRGRAFSKALYWSDTNAFGPRAYFLTVSKPATLSVDNVQLDDEGVSILHICIFSLFCRRYVRLNFHFTLLRSPSTGLSLSSWLPKFSYEKSSY